MTHACYDVDRRQEIVKDLHGLPPGCVQAACCVSSIPFASSELPPGRSTVKVLEVPVKAVIWPVKPFLKSPK